MTAVLSKMQFCTDYVYLRKRLIDFSGRPYLRAIYEVSDRNLVLRCSRQVEKSTFLANSIAHAACTRPGVQLLYSCPREEQARRFSRDRLLPVIEQSPLIRRLLLGRNRRRPPVMNLEFANGSRLFVRGVQLRRRLPRLKRGHVVRRRGPGHRGRAFAGAPGNAQSRSVRNFNSRRHPQVCGKSSRGVLLPIDGPGMAGSVPAVSAGCSARRALPGTASRGLPPLSEPTVSQLWPLGPPPSRRAVGRFLVKSSDGAVA